MIVETKCGDRTAPALTARLLSLPGSRSQRTRCRRPSRRRDRDWRRACEVRARLLRATGSHGPCPRADPASINDVASGNGLEAGVAFPALRRHICSSGNLRPETKKAGTNQALNRVNFLSRVGQCFPRAGPQARRAAGAETRPPPIRTTGSAENRKSQTSRRAAAQPGFWLRGTTIQVVR